MAMSSKQRHDGDSAPLFITVGPPCSGKTTWLKQKAKQDALLDVCLDDQPFVYIPLPFDLFCMSPAEMKQADLPLENQALLERSYFNKSVRERILAPDQQELRWVLQRLSGRISASEFSGLLLPAKENTPNEPPARETKVGQDAEFAAETLLECTETLLDDQLAVSGLPSTVNLFVLESLFQIDPALAKEPCTGIERATNLLQQSPKGTPLAWGNTNTKSRDYMNALQIAQEQGRPVYFCVYGDNNRYGVELFDLPKLEFRQLVERNLQRLLRTGQYIPCNVIQGISGRVDQLIGDALRNFGNGRPPTKFDLDRGLARLAGFDLRDDRRPIRKQTYDRNGRSSQWQKQNPSNRGRGHQGRVYQGRGYQGQSRGYQGPSSKFQPRQGPNQYRPRQGSNQYRQDYNRSLNQPDDPLGSSTYQRREGAYRPYNRTRENYSRQGRNWNIREQGSNGYASNTGYVSNYPRGSQYNNAQQGNNGYRAPRNSDEEDWRGQGNQQRREDVADDPWDDVGDESRFPDRSRHNSGSSLRSDPHG